MARPAMGQPAMARIRAAPEGVGSAKAPPPSMAAHEEAWPGAQSAIPQRTAGRPLRHSPPGRQHRHRRCPATGRRVSPSSLGWHRCGQSPHRCSRQCPHTQRRRWTRCPASRRHPSSRIRRCRPSRGRSPQQPSHRLRWSRLRCRRSRLRCRRSRLRCRRSRLRRRRPSGPPRPCGPGGQAAEWPASRSRIAGPRSDQCHLCRRRTRRRPGPPSHQRGPSRPPPSGRCPSRPCQRRPVTLSWPLSTPMSGPPRQQSTASRLARSSSRCSSRPPPPAGRSLVRPALLVRRVTSLSRRLRPLRRLLLQCLLCCPRLLCCLRLLCCPRLLCRPRLLCCLLLLRLLRLLRLLAACCSCASCACRAGVCRGGRVSACRGGCWQRRGGTGRRA